MNITRYTIPNILLGDLEPGTVFTVPDQAEAVLMRTKNTIFDDDDPASYWTAINLETGEMLTLDLDTWVVSYPEIELHFHK